jgi:hypothetical protein
MGSPITEKPQIINYQQNKQQMDIRSSHTEVSMQPMQVSMHTTFGLEEVKSLRHRLTR